jgi:eukaryotic-like serine/threonine-protein kinase
VLSSLKRSGSKPGLSPGPFGRFHLQELINSGGMADIWLATDEKNKGYAVRLMHERLRFNLAARRRFLKGCEVLSRLSGHEHIIGYYEHGKLEGRLYCLMEYIEAENLKDLFTRQDPVLAENVAQILIDMAEALEHMHGNGYMHLDFKPENVLVSPNGGVRLVDFDLAQPIPEKETKLSKKNPGTPAYMAPEQLLGQPISNRVDIFAFGVTAYELLTNRKPFPGETPSEILGLQTERATFLEPRTLNADIPLALEKVLLRCLEYDPSRRYPVIGVMGRELKAALYVS